MPTHTYFNNVGGLNLANSPFAVAPDQATAGFCYEYSRPGAIVKTLGRSKSNAVADAQAYTHGLGVFTSVSGNKTVIRSAGTKLQTVNPDSGIFSNISEDTSTPITDFFSATSTTPAVFTPFDMAGVPVLWTTGAGSSTVLGYNGTSATENGVPSPTGAFTTSVSGSEGLWPVIGSYYYAIVLRKTSTQSLSNAGLDIKTVIAATTDEVTLTFPTGIDTTKYDQWYVYRSAVGGVNQFTTGTLVAQVATTTLTYVDNGLRAVATEQTVPRADFVVLDNSTLPRGASASALLGGIAYTAVVGGTGGNNISIQYTSGATAGAEVVTVTGSAITVQIQSGVSTIVQVMQAVLNKNSSAALVYPTTIDADPNTTVVTVAGPSTLTNGSNYTYSTLTAFKRRLITSQGNTLYISDIDKPESWPTDLRVTLPYGGPITGVGIISSLSEITDNTDEFLAIFQERYLWMISGSFIFDETSGLYDFQLKFVDKKGCASQSLIVNGDSFIGWMNTLGVYLWDGTGKPMVVSRTIKTWFDKDGDLDKTNLGKGWGVHYQKKNMFVWTVSHRTIGMNKVQLKLDLNLTSPKIEAGPGGRYMDAVFILDKTDTLNSGVTYMPSSSGDEQFVVGDSSGFIYKMYASSSDNSSGIPFSYRTGFLDQGTPGVAKRYKKVLVWVDPIVQKDLTLNYWADFRNQAATRSTIPENMGSNSSTPSSLWDVAEWDNSFWDDYENEPKCIVFNLHAKQNNVEGDCLMLEFVQNEASAPVVIHGFSVIYDDIGIRK